MLKAAEARPVGCRHRISHTDRFFLLLLVVRKQYKKRERKRKRICRPQLFLFFDLFGFLYKCNKLPGWLLYFKKLIEALVFRMISKQNLHFLIELEVCYFCCYGIFSLLCKKIGIDETKYSIHSLRRGGATHSYEKVANLLDIQRHGAWSSLAFHDYIAPEPDHTTSVCSALAF